MDITSILLLFLYLSMLAIGYIIGAAARKKGKKIAWTGRALYIAVAILIFVMGVRIGSNKEIVSSLGTIGITSLVLTLVVMACSIGAVFAARKLTGIDRKGVRSK